MILQIFTVHDSKTEAWLAPFFSQTIESGTRAFATVARDEKHDFNMNGGDYSLFHIGSFDQDSGELVKNHTPTNLGLAINFAHNPIQRSENLRGIQGGE